MKRFVSFFAAALLGLAVLWPQTAVADLGGLSYDIPKGRKSLVDSLTFRSRGTPERQDTIIGAALRDTTMGMIPIAGLKSWSVMWIYTDAPGPATNTTWAVNCTLQVSHDTTNWVDVTPGAGVWAITTSVDQIVYQRLFNRDTADSAVGIANGPGVKRMIDGARYARFKIKVANSADDTVYLKAIQHRVYVSD